MKKLLFPLAFTAFALAACAPTSRFDADVTRFHLGAPERGAVALVPFDENAETTLEYQNYADAVATELRAAGFDVVASGNAAPVIGKIMFGQTSREGLPKRSPISIGIGGGTGGRNVGVGVGTTFGVGKKKSSEIVTNFIELRLIREADGKTLWEGRAQAELSGDHARAPLAASIPALANSLLRDFPGASGQTVRYTE